jgi:glycerol-3-phosphate O-acyltransferase/dihydroxyacetone phosphate acyltransferase
VYLQVYKLIRLSDYGRYGKPIQVTEFLDDYYKEPKATAKKVMKILEDSLLSLTINSPDWPNCHSATMAREMLFPGDYGNMPDFIEVTQR